MRFGNHETNTREHFLGGTQSCIDFPNGYGLSILTGHKFLHCGPSSYEVAIIYNEEIVEVIGYRTEDEVAALLDKYAAA